MARQDREAGEVQAAVTQHLQEDWESARSACGFDAQIGFGFGEAQPFGAPDEEGRRGLAEVEAALVDFREVGREVRLGAPRAGDDLAQAKEEHVVGERCRRLV